MFMRVPLPLLGAFGGLSLAACAVPAPDAGEARDTRESSATATAIIAVERTAGPGDAVRGDAVVARFVRVTQGIVDEPALRIAGVGQDFPAPGACIVPSDQSVAQAPRRADSYGTVELLDVGQVTLASGSDLRDALATKSTVLLPRAMPDPAGVVSGVFYSSRSADVFTPGARVTLRSSGGADLLEGFNVSVTAPRDVTDVRVANLPGTGVEVAWDAIDADAHDVVYVDVLSPSPRVIARCGGTDAGRLVIPQASVAAMRDGEEGQIVVHRLHREAFRSKGIEPGEVRFDVARVVTFRR
jgi:hypothetical protein